MIFISRCAWHRKYFGQTLWTKVERLDGDGLQYSDGICQECAGIARKEMRL